MKIFVKRTILSKGTTMVEMLLYMGIFLLLLGTMMQLFSSILDVRLESDATSSVTQDGRYILARFTYDLQNAQSIATPASAGGTAPTMQFVTSGITYTYSLVSGNLQVSDGTNTNILNSYDTSVSNVSFQRLGNTNGKNTVTISFTLTSATKRVKGFEVKTFQETAGLR